MNKRVFLGLLSVAALAAFGCDDSQSVDTNESDDIQSYTFSVKIDNTVSGSVDLAEMSDKVVEIEVAGSSAKGVSIADVISKANNIDADKLDEYLSQYMCEYEGKDGFKPSDKGDRCPVVSCSEAVRSYINVDSHRIFYAADTSMANVGCYNVSDAVSVLMYKKDAEQTGDDTGVGDNGGDTGTGGDTGSGENETTEAYNIDVVVNGTVLATVNATELADGADSVSVAALFEAAGISFDLASARCEAQVIDHEDASNSFYPSVKDNCKEWLTCDVMAAGSISLEASTINYTSSLSGCYSPKGMNTIAIKLANNIDIVVDEGEPVTVDISSMADADGNVSVAAIFEAAGISIDLASSYCEAEVVDENDASNSYYPSSKGQCKDVDWLTCDIVADASIDTATNKIVYASEQFGCFGTKGTNTIAVKTTK